MLEPDCGLRHSHIRSLDHVEITTHSIKLCVVCVAIASESVPLRHAVDYAGTLTSPSFDARLLHL